MAELIGSILEWHQAARPKPSESDLSVQIGCHLEEVVEMMKALSFVTDGNRSHVQAANHTVRMLEGVADDLKAGRIKAVVRSRVGVLDGLCDQMVTGIGVAHCAGLDVIGGLTEVNLSNWSKFVDGDPVFDDNGKVAKGPDYAPPKLDRFV